MAREKLGNSLNGVWLHDHQAKIIEELSEIYNDRHRDEMDWRLTEMLKRAWEAGKKYGESLYSKEEKRASTLDYLDELEKSGIVTRSTYLPCTDSKTRGVRLSVDVSESSYHSIIHDFTNETARALGHALLEIADANEEKGNL